jgi:SAM-dependent methyltransferase
MPYPDLSAYNWIELNDLREAARYRLLAKFADADPFNMSRSVNLARRVGHLLPHVKGHDDFHILEFGCGPYNPYALALVLYLNGYPKITSTDLCEPWHQFIAARGMYEAALHAIAFPEFWSLNPDSTNDERESIRKRAYALPLASLNEGKLDALRQMPKPPFQYLSLLREREKHTEASYDYIYSISVFEHVMEPLNELVWHYKLLRPGGYNVLIIDLRDHRFLDDPERFSPWSFMEDGIYGVDQPIRGDLRINGLRSSQLRRLAEAAGFEVKTWQEEPLYEAPPKLLDKIRPEFKALPLTDLTTLRVTAELRKPD